MSGDCKPDVKIELIPGVEKTSKLTNISPTKPGADTSVTSTHCFHVSPSKHFQLPSDSFELILPEILVVQHFLLQHNLVIPAPSHLTRAPKSIKVIVPSL